MKKFQKKMKSWFVPFCNEIESEIKLISMGVSGQNRKQYCGPLLLLPSESIAVICLKTVLSMTMKTGNAGVPVVTLAQYIGEQIELEVGVQKLSLTTANLKPWESAIIEKLNKESKTNPQKQTHKATINKLRKLMQEDTWDFDTKIKLGAFILKIMLETAKYNDSPAFTHNYSYTKGKKKGVITMDEKLFSEFTDSGGQIAQPKYYPMLVPPLKWSNKKNSKGVNFLLRTSLMRSKNTNFKLGEEMLRKAHVPKLLEALDYLGQVSWVVYNPVKDVIKALYFDMKMVVGELPSQNLVELPNINDFYRTVKKTDPITGEIIEVSELDKKSYNSMCYKVKLRNAELHSLRCEVEIRLKIIDKFANEKFYFPCNLDFRGRVYPLSPNFSHLGSDLCRGTLRFAEGKPLGELGLYWLKVHLANLFGNNKILFEERAKWVEDNMDNLIDSATNPLDGQRWWATAESPFQALSTCMEIHAAISSGDPASFISNLPIHADGSCNGLQHYAALGKGITSSKLVFIYFYTCFIVKIMY
jgi:DNA-directed RNA polymerase